MVGVFFLANICETNFFLNTVWVFFFKVLSCLDSQQAAGLKFEMKVEKKILIYVYAKEITFFKK